MLTLASDTSSPAGSIAVLRDSQVIGLVAGDSEETYSSRLFRELRCLLEELRLSLPDIDLYAVASGPGSFTGLRVGLSAVKGFAEIHGKPIAPVSVLEAIAAASGCAGRIAAILDARRGQFYGGVFEVGEEIELRGEEIVAEPREWLERLQKELGSGLQWIATPTPEVLESLLPPGASVRVVTRALAEVIGRRGLAKYRRGLAISALELDANYIRRSDAELLWKGK